MQKVGEILKAEREKKGLSLHEIGMTLKINPKILKAIEDNDATQLPAKTFLRGFVRSYAQYLRLDVNLLLNQLHSEIGSTRPEEIIKPSEELSSNGKAAAPAPLKEQPSTKNEKSKKIRHDSGLTGKKVLTFVGTILLILMIIFVAKTIDKYQKESRRPKIEIEETQKVPTREEPVATETPVEADPNLHPDTLISPMNSPSPSESPPSTLSSPAPAVSATSAVAAQTPIPTLTPIPTPTPSPIPTPTLTPTSNPSPTPVPVTVIMKPVEVIVEALNKVEVKYSFDDQKYETIMLMSDELHTFKSKTGIKLEISDGGAVSLIVNGREKGVPGTIGKAIKLSYPK